jgi:hypothetical protein
MVPSRSVTMYCVMAGSYPALMADHRVVSLRGCIAAVASDLPGLLAADCPRPARCAVNVAVIFVFGDPGIASHLRSESVNIDLIRETAR